MIDIASYLWVRFWGFILSWEEKRLRVQNYQNTMHNKRDIGQEGKKRKENKKELRGIEQRKGNGFKSIGLQNTQNLASPHYYR